jgi:hypothetical protein
MDLNLALRSPSDGRSNTDAALSLEERITKESTEQSSTSEWMLKPFDPTKDGFG